MSDLIKYNQNNLLVARIAQALGREVDHVGEDVKTRPASLVIKGGFKAGQPSSIAQERIADLPRLCALLRRPYAARYIAIEHRWQHSQCFPVTQTIYRQLYANNRNQIVLSTGELDEEVCPICGAGGYGSILCTRCGSEVCYGKSTFDSFGCACGNRGALKTSSRNQGGMLL